MNRAKVFVIIAVGALFVAQTLITRCSVDKARKAQDDAEAAMQDARDTEAALQAAIDEGKRLADMVERYDAAMKAATQAANDAARRAQERARVIESIDAEWGACELPSGAMDAVREYVCAP